MTFKILWVAYIGGWPLLFFHRKSWTFWFPRYLFVYDCSLLNFYNCLFFFLSKTPQATTISIFVRRPYGPMNVNSYNIHKMGNYYFLLHIGSPFITVWIHSVSSKTLWGIPNYDTMPCEFMERTLFSLRTPQPLCLWCVLLLIP